jgi:hypothetical protein
MSRFGLFRSRDGAVSGLDAAPSATPALPDARPATPTVGETLYEISIVLALHLAFAFAVLLTLRAFGVS